MDMQECRVGLSEAPGAVLLNVKKGEREIYKEKPSVMIVFV